jgi:hypothetical protein
MICGNGDSREGNTIRIRIGLFTVDSTNLQYIVSVHSLEHS